MKSSEGWGETNFCSLALGTRRSNIDADAAYLRRIDVNITSFDNVTKVFEVLRRLRYGMRLFSFTHCASPNLYYTTVHESQ